MARNAWPTVFSGDAWSAAQHNTYGRDNDAAYWPYTTRGDISICATANTLRRQGVGLAGQVLRTNVFGTDWEAGWPNLPLCKVQNSADQSLGTSETTIYWNTDVKDPLGWHDPFTNTQWITPNVAGEYIASLYFAAAGVAGSGTATWTFRCYTAAGALVYRYNPLFDAFTKQQMITTPLITCNGSTDAIGWTIQHNEGATRTMLALSVFSVFRIGA